MQFILKSKMVIAYLYIETIILVFQVIIASVIVIVAIYLSFSFWSEGHYKNFMTIMFGN